MFRNPRFLLWLGGLTFAAGFAVAQEHPRAIIALRGGSMKILEETGKSEIHEWQTGKAYWLDANAAGTRHRDINVGETPIEVLVVELQNEK